MLARMGFWGTFLVVLVVLAAAIVAALLAFAVVQVLRDRSITWRAQAAWLVTIVALPLGGALAWFAVGHRTKEFASTFAR